MDQSKTMHLLLDAMLNDGKHSINENGARKINTVHTVSKGSPVTYIHPGTEVSIRSLSSGGVVVAEYLGKHVTLRYTDFC